MAVVVGFIFIAIAIFVNAAIIMGGIALVKAQRGHLDRMAELRSRIPAPRYTDTDRWIQAEFEARGWDNSGLLSTYMKDPEENRT
jgi:hypothetical protein